jgi:hypothetical protein
MVEWKPLQNLDFHIPKTSTPAPSAPRRPVQRTDMGQHHKKTTSIKGWAVLMIIVGMCMCFGSMAGGGPPGGAGKVGVLLCVVGFFMFLAGRLRQ